MGASFKSKRPLAEAEAEATELRSFLLATGYVRVEVCGSVRRRRAEVGDLDLVVDGDLAWLEEPACPWRYVDGGPAKATIDFHGTQVNVLRADEHNWGTALFYFTGPAAYNVAYRARAKKLGFKLNEYGLWNGPVRLAGKTEEEVYRALGKEWKAPELRGL